jgi:hypothetical protein
MISIHRTRRGLRVQAAVLLSMTCVASCATTQVKTHRDPEAPLASYLSFKVEGGEVVEHGVAEHPDSVANDSVEIALHDALTDKGLAPNDAQPDLLVRYKASAQGVTVFGAPNLTQNEIWTNQGERDRYIENVVVIDLIDPDTDELVWRSTATAEDADFAKPEQVAKIVKEALKKYPSRS